MGHFVGREPYRVRLRPEDEEWIAIKPKLGVADRQRLTDAVVVMDRSRSDVDKGEVQLDLRLGQFLTALLQIGVVGWRLFKRDEAGEIARGEDGQPVEVPYDPDLVPYLDPDDPLVDRVLQELARRNPTRAPGADAASG